VSPWGGAIYGPRDFICAKLNPVSKMLHANSKSILASKRFLKLFAIFILYKIMSPWDGTIYDPRKFIRTHLNLHVPRILQTKYQCIQASGS